MHYLTLGPPDDKSTHSPHSQIFTSLGRGRRRRVGDGVARGPRYAAER